MRFDGYWNKCGRVVDILMVGYCNDLSRHLKESCEMAALCAIYSLSSVGKSQNPIILNVQKPIHRTL